MGDVAIQALLHEDFHGMYEGDGNRRAQEDCQQGVLVRRSGLRKI
jgi:hypothetical protein